MRVSPIQRMASMVLIVTLIFWFYQKQEKRFKTNNFPLISNVEQTIYSPNPEADKFFLENFLNMEVLNIKFNEILFREGIILKNTPRSNIKNYLDTALIKNSVDPSFLSPDTIQLRTRRMDELWAQITFSNARIITPPTTNSEGLFAYFKLPGGTIVRLVGRE
ncbi:MAG: hypothetical protein KAI81_04240 [Candidatus Marinimicrobia bacterium]|nr:hypothetical protein [Candidatus Neomarinimicrobiota bacterium]